MKRRILLAALACLSVAGSARADCTYTVAPKVTLTDDGLWDAGVDVGATGYTQISATWSINCMGACRSDWQEAGGPGFYYASSPDIEAAAGCDDLGDQVGQGVCTAVVAGVNVIAISGGRCGDPFQNTGGATMVTSDAVVIPPLVGDTSEVHAFPPITDTENFINFVDDAHVSVGVPFRVSGDISVTPAGSDTVTFRVEGAGMHVSRSYGAVTNNEGTPQDQGNAWSSDPDPSVSAVPTEPGDFQFWVELNGVKSQVLTMHAVNAADGGSGDGSTGSSGSTGAPAGKGHGGCGSASGGLLLALTALGLLALRRQRG